MKEIILATAFSLIFAIILTIILRRNIEKPLVRITRVSWFMAMVLFCSHIALPDNLGFLPDDGIRDSMLNAFVCVFLFIASVYGGWIQLYNLAERGFSLRILVDILESDEDALNLDEVSTRYSRGRGIGWMYQKRIDDMNRLELISVEKNYISLTPKGRKLAGIFTILRNIYSFPDEAEFKK